MFVPVNPLPGRAGVKLSLQIALLVLIIAVAAIAVAVQFARYANGTGEDAVAIAYCKADYQRARTHQDTLFVDDRVPITSRAQASAAVSCGVHRLARQIR